MKRLPSLLLLIVITLLITACKRHEPAPAVSGNTSRGAQLINQYGCNSCHIIPGVEGAKGMVGPSLEHVASRQMIAGKLPNSPQNLTQYIQNPQMADPANAMPNLGVKPDEAQDIAAYLSTLK